MLSPPSTSARLPLRSGGITSWFAVGRASGRDDQRFPPLHRPIERLGKRPPRLAGEPCPAPLFWDVVRGEGRKGPSCGCHPMGHWVRGEGSHAADRPEPASWGHSLPHPPPLVRSLKVPGGARSAGASSPVRTGLANSGRRVERLPLKVGDDPLAVAEMCGAGCPPSLKSPSLWD